jgi:hypothetical protein
MSRWSDLEGKSQEFQAGAAFGFLIAHQQQKTPVADKHEQDAAAPTAANHEVPTAQANARKQFADRERARRQFAKRDAKRTAKRGAQQCAPKSEKVNPSTAAPQPRDIETQDVPEPPTKRAPTLREAQHSPENTTAVPLPRETDTFARQDATEPRDQPATEAPTTLMQESMQSQATESPEPAAEAREAPSVAVRENPTAVPLPRETEYTPARKGVTEPPTKRYQPATEAPTTDTTGPPRGTVRHLQGPRRRPHRDPYYEDHHLSERHDEKTEPPVKARPRPFEKSPS